MGFADGIICIGDFFHFRLKHRGNKGPAVFAVIPFIIREYFKVITHLLFLLTETNLAYFDVTVNSNIDYSSAKTGYICSQAGYILWVGKNNYIRKKIHSGVIFGVFLGFIVRDLFGNYHHGTVR